MSSSVPAIFNSPVSVCVLAFVLGVLILQYLCMLRTEDGVKNYYISSIFFTGACCLKQTQGSWLCLDLLAKSFWEFPVSDS